MHLRVLDDALLLQTLEHGMHPGFQVAPCTRILVLLLAHHELSVLVLHCLTLEVIVGEGGDLLDPDHGNILL